ncbi:MAG: hypothetical protein O3B96_02205 [bacterium]|nr:hypothetical protein [bacterium]
MPTTSPQNTYIKLAIAVFTLLASSVLISLAVQGGLGKSIERRIGNFASG